MLTTAQAKAPLDVVKRLGAVQAQDYQAALWAIGVRCGGDITKREVEKELENASIARNWLLRGTLHISASEDMRWMIKPSMARLQKIAAIRDQHLGLLDGRLDRSKEVLESALRGGKRVTRSEAYRILEKAGIPASDNLGYHLLYRAAWDGLICFGPNEGDEQTFVLRDEWAHYSKMYSDEDIIGELAVRYFSGHGPATVFDFAWWAGIKVSEGRQGILDAKERLICEEAGSKEYYSCTDASLGGGMDSSVILLPAFDEYVLGYRDRSPVLARDGDKNAAGINEKRIAHSNGIFLPTIISGGLVIGTWKKQVRNNRVRIMLNPFNPMDSEQLSGVKESADSYGSFFGMDVEVKY